MRVRSSFWSLILSPYAYVSSSHIRLQLRCVGTAPWKSNLMPFRCPYLLSHGGETQTLSNLWTPCSPLLYTNSDLDRESTHISLLIEEVVELIWGPTVGVKECFHRWEGEHVEKQSLYDKQWLQQKAWHPTAHARTGVRCS